VTVAQTARRAKGELDDRRVIVLEFVAASSIFAIIGFVLFMVFSYQAR
jgi:hypothetical protein